MHRRQSEAVERVTRSLRRDGAVRAIFLKGSIARREDDAHSDVDLYCIISSGEMKEFLQRRRKHVQEYRPVLYSSEVNFVAPQLVVVFDDLLHLDLYTTTRAGLPSTDEIHILHDPEELLADYRAEPLSLTDAGAAAAFDRFTFTLLEYDAARRRGQDLWAARLVSHLTGELGQVLRHLHQPEWGQLGIKGLQEHLPQELRERLRAACEAMTPHSHPVAARSLVQLAREVLEKLPPDVRAGVSERFFRRMARVIDQP